MRLPAVLAAVDDVIRDVAATIVMPKFDTLTAADIFEKSPGDLVTVADRDAESALTGRLGALLDVAVLGEEAASADPQLLDRARQGEHLWIIDPIDGTANFAHHRREFALMVALAWHGELAASWIYQPTAERMFTARAGKGAWLNGVPLRTLGTSCPPLDKLAGSFTFRRTDPIFPAYRERVDRFARLDAGNGSAGWEYPSMAQGTTDFAIFKRSLPWDHAPGALLLRETGGVVRRWDGSDYHLADGKTGLVAARNSAIWDLVAATLPAPPAADLQAPKAPPHSQ